MGHRRSVADGGTSHLRNIVALCYPCNLEQGTTSFAKSERDMEYVKTSDKVKSWLNENFSIGSVSFDISNAKRSRSVDAELEEFRKRVKKNSREWADKKYRELRPLARRYITTKDPSYEKYQRMCWIIFNNYN